MGPPEITWSTLTVREIQLEQVVQGRIQLRFEYLQGQRLHNFPGEPVLAPDHPHSRKLHTVFIRRYRDSLEESLTD